MSETVSRHRRQLLSTGLWFLLLSLPSLAFRWWNPEPLRGFRSAKHRWMAGVLRRAPTVRMGIVGSSRIWTALDAPKISQALYGRPEAVVHFGTNYAGRGRDYLIARELLSNLPTVDTLVVEVWTSESNEVHPDFHRLASLGDSLRDPLNRVDIPSSTREWRERINFWVVESFGNLVAGYSQALLREIVHRRYSDSGFNPFTETWGTFRWKAALKRPPDPWTRSIYRPLRRDRGMSYLVRIAELCRSREVGLILVEVPMYGEPELGESYMSFLESLGQPILSFPAREELFEPSKWKDGRHMNVHGAALFSDWFAAELRSLNRSTAPTRR